jgi:hypothetical protein
MRKLSQIWFEIQEVLFPFVEEKIEEPLTEKLKNLVTTLELIRIDEMVRVPEYWQGRSPKNRKQIARAFIAKAIYNIDTTRALIDRLRISPSLRRICGWQKACDVPHESSFSRAFKEFSKSGLTQIVQASVIKEYMGDKITGHISRDSTSIDAREKPMKKIKVVKQKKKRGRPRKDEVRIKEPTRLERQQSMGINEMLEDLPNACDVGTKMNSKGYKKSWAGYKLHIDAADGHIPISCVLTSASVHDSQVALPLAELTDQQVNSLYDLMDSAYDSPIIKKHSRSLGHVPIIDMNPRGNKGRKLELKAEVKRCKFLNFKNPTDIRYNERSNVERVNGRLKDEFGGKMVRVRGHAKVMTHLMFGIIALTADQLIRFVT